MNRPTFLRRSTALLLTLVLMVCAALPGFAAYQMPIQTASDTESVYLFNLDTGKPILRQNSDQQRYIASLTKMMTALLFLESGKDMNAEITIPTSLTQEFKDIQNANGSTMNLRIGETVRRIDLLYGLLVASANAGWVVRHILSNPVTRFVSSVSMQFYIWHQTLAVWLLRARIIPSVSATPNYDGELLWQKRYTFVCFAVALLLAALLTYGFERPASRRLLGKNLLGKTGKKQKRA